MFKIDFSDKIKAAAPGLKVIKIEAAVKNGPTDELLWERIQAAADKISEGYAIEMVNKRPGILATRLAYKALGKDPNRYRPSSEALCRRIVNGKGIYRLTTLVDLINLLSIATGYSIGGFDSDKINGNKLTLDAGNADDLFHGIGRGALNIEGLPVYRDATGGIGTPTSDEERTKITEDTKNLLMLINVYGEEMPLSDTINMASSLLIEFAGADPENINIETVAP